MRNWTGVYVLVMTFGFLLLAHFLLAQPHYRASNALVWIAGSSFFLGIFCSAALWLRYHTIRSARNLLSLPAYVLLASLLTGLGAPGYVLAANVWLDFRPETEYRGMIDRTSRDVSTGSSRRRSRQREKTAYHVHLSIYGGPISAARLKISQDEYKSLASRTPVLVRVKPGLLGMPWVRGFRLDHARIQ